MQTFKKKYWGHLFHVPVLGMPKTETSDPQKY